MQSFGDGPFRFHINMEQLSTAELFTGQMIPMGLIGAGHEFGGFLMQVTILKFVVFNFFWI